MKIRIKTYNDKLPSYLTVGKEYLVVDKLSENVVSCISDDGFRFDACIKGSSQRLNGGSWEVVECIEHKFLNTTNLCIICGKSKSEFIAEKVKAQQDELKIWKELQ